MAWIKFEHTTPDKPEVVEMAALLRLDQDAVVGKLLRVWAWADQNSIEGGEVRVNGAFLDRLTSRKGFANALRSVGWLTGEDGRLTFPNFDRHNGETAKSRAMTARRMQEMRLRGGAKGVTENGASGYGDVTADVTPGASPKASPEKRREDKSIQNTPLPPASGGAVEQPVGTTEATPAATTAVAHPSIADTRTDGGAPATSSPSNPPAGPVVTKPRRSRAALAGEPILPETQPEPLRSRMLALGTLVRRRPTTAWSEDELAALKKSGLLAAGDDEFAEQMDLMERFCAPPNPPDTPQHARDPLHFRRVGLFRKLKYWPEELDKARAWVEQKEAERRAALPPGR